jgi:glycosyltransferase involved in cell wall biosynthesis
VIVPTRDRPIALRRCLDALSAQTVADLLEVVVVDDGSLATEEVKELVALHPCARLIRRSGGGPAAARNAGVQDASGAVLCFTDDDCAPRPDWVERLVAALRRGADVAVGATSSGGGGALAEASELVGHAPAVAPAPEGSDLAFAPSNNLACTKAVYEATPFDESYPHAAGEDRDWCARVTAAGFVLRSEPAARVVHHQDLTLRRFLRQQIRYGEGAFRFRRLGGERRPLESPDFYIALLRRAFMRGFAVGVLVCAAQAASAAGFVGAWASSRTEARVIKASTALRSSPSRRDGL